MAKPLTMSPLLTIGKYLLKEAAAYSEGQEAKKEF